MKTSTDVLVCGAGCAGLAAALAAARSGANVMLVERAPFAGGILTCVGLPFFDGIKDERNHKVVTPGIPVELFSRLGFCPPGARTIEQEYPKITNTERVKLVLDEMLLAESPRLSVLYHAFAADTVVKNGRIQKVMIACKQGLVAVEAKVVIDATGDADIASTAGAPIEKTPPLQPMTLHFRIGNVKPIAGTRESRAKAQAECIAAHEAGELNYFYGPGYGFRFAADELDFHAVRVPADGSDADDLTRAEMQGRRDAWTMFERFKKNVPGFEDSYFKSSGPYIGVRETRRIVGEYVLTEQDIKANKKFDDAIATGIWYLDQHPNAVTVGKANDCEKYQPDPYDIPYRSLIARNLENLLVAGRCHSATQLAASSTRVTCTAMAMGQAAGVAATMASQDKIAVQEMNALKLRQRLSNMGFGVAI